MGAIITVIVVVDALEHTAVTGGGVVVKSNFRYNEKLTAKKTVTIMESAYG